MNKSIFTIDDANQLLTHVWKGNNVRIIDGIADNNKCIIFCSSHGIYFPNTYGEFRKKIICNDYYEWSRLASLLIEYVERIILIRDVRKSFYVTGISEKYNSIDSVLDMLRKYTDGYEIITAGSSGGGYMASIIGMYLKAKYVINAGGQWNLYERDNVVEKYYFLNKNKDDNIYSKWFDLNKQLENNNTPILYLFGARNEIDIEQIKCAERIKNVYPIGINSNAHAQSVSTESYLHLLLAEWEDIYKIFLMDKHNIIKISELEEQINSYIELPTNMTMDITKTREQQKQEAYLELLYEWVEMEQNGKETKKYLDDLRTVAIWGKGKCCDLLINDLKARGNEVVCIIESNPLVEEYKELPVISIEDLPNNVDTIIIVPYYDSVEIKEKIKCRPDVKVIGIDEFIKR